MKPFKKMRFENILVIACLLLSACSNRDNTRRPNILFITTDYQAWEDVPELTPVLDMPAIDRLCREGVVFTNHNCVAPVCMPARHTIVSGTYPHTHGTMGNGYVWPRESEHIMMDQLREAGYQTVSIGKMHYNPWDRNDGFDLRIIADCQGNKAYDTLKHDDYAKYLARAGKTRWDYLKCQGESDLFGVYDWPMDDTLNIDYYVGDQTIKLIKNKKLAPDNPWFMWVSFNGPHNPWDPPAEFSEPYMNVKLPGVRHREGELLTKPVSQTRNRYNYTRRLPDDFDRNPEKRDEYLQRVKAGHYGSLTFIDRQIERIMAALEEEGILKNTMIVFSADHGTHLGDHNLFHKATVYERSAHVPMVIWWPEVLEKRRIKGFTSHVDIFPTLVEIGGGTLPDELEGVSRYPELVGKRDGDEYTIVEISNNYFYVTDEYKLGLYTPYREGDLYDRIKDPDELYNVYHEPEYREVVDSLSEKLYQFWPEIERIMADRIELHEPPETVEIHQGDILKSIEVPYMAGKSVNVEAWVELEKDASGPMVTNHVDNTHGFCLFMENGKICIGIRKWDEDTIFSINHQIPAGKIKIIMSLSVSGKLEVSVPAHNIHFSANTDWPLMVQPGRPEAQTGVLRAGVAGNNWFNPFGNLKRGQDLDGVVIKAVVSVNKSV